MVQKKNLASSSKSNTDEPMKAIRIHIIIALLLFFSCISEELVPHSPSPVPGERTLSLHIAVRSSEAPVAFAYTPARENQILELDVLVFKVEGREEHYYKHIPIRSLPDIAGGAFQTVKINLAPIDARLILLANAGSMFTGETVQLLERYAQNGNIQKKTILEHFIFDSSSQWTASSGSGEGSAIPMYGESALIPAQSDAPSEINMLRALARIDIGTNNSSAGIVIDSVYIFNTKDKGFVAPAFDNAGNITSMAHIPLTARSNSTSLALHFTPNAESASPAMEREIYIAEDDRSGALPTSIVIKAKTGSSDRPAFYSLDLRDKGGSPIPFLRNSRYGIIITGISGSGYSTPEAALNSAGSPSVSTELETDELGISEIVFNDKYKLGVSQTQIIFNADGSFADASSGDNICRIKVYTTCPAWSVSADEAACMWLSIPGLANSRGEVEYPATTRYLPIAVSPNTESRRRAALITLKAINLRLNITILQDGNEIKKQ
ncbi:MAG: hypothetical protein LBH04_00340 [Tannerellaceae bacterium]|jgi:hypothetical protein|nr:hypothetical protein [Tannerellaceae bacterium]